MIAVTGATGHLGHHVIDQLLEKVPAQSIVALVRSPDKAAELKRRGVQVRLANYDQPETLAPALAGIEKLLLISASEVGKRVAQHRAILEAAKKAGVKVIVYTSLLHTDRAQMSLASEHLETEKLLRASGVPFVILRNGWYLENYTENLGSALQHGAMMGAAKNGRISAASRADYAAAAVNVITGRGHEGKVYELGGDLSFSMPELAQEVARQSGKPVAYKDVPEGAYSEALVGFGLPKVIAQMLASADAGIARGELEENGGALHRLIGRETTPLSKAVGAALQR